MSDFEFIKQPYGGLLCNTKDSSSIVVNRLAAHIITYLNSFKSMDVAKEKFAKLFPASNKYNLYKDFDQFLISLASSGIKKRRYS